MNKLCILIKNQCIDCKTKITKQAKRCRACNNKLGILIKNQCIDCGKEISRVSLRCSPCNGKHNVCRGIKKCIDCGKKIRWRSIRCIVCNGKSKEFRERIRIRQLGPKSSFRGHKHTNAVKQHNKLERIDYYKKYPEMHPCRRVAGNMKRMVNGEKIIYKYLKNIGLNPKHNKLIAGYYADFNFSIKNNNFIIESFGDYWHADPKRYNANDIVHHNFTAQQIWQKDNLRKDRMSAKGYKIYRVWDRRETKTKPQDIIEQLNKIFKKINNI